MTQKQTPTRRALQTLVLLGLLATSGVCAQAKPQVELRTNLGTITIELYPDVAPNTVRNFLQYVNDVFYNGTTFHRVIDNFMIQGGGYTPDMRLKPTRSAIAFENINRLPNVAGSVAMARTSEPNSATSQFFINVVNNASLDFRGSSNFDIGYVVFGQVINGMDVVKTIQRTPVATAGALSNVPVQAVVMEQVTMVGGLRQSSPATTQQDDPKVFGRSARGG
jgi:peptidyl-prolyl cis-trans isomerase A (cyclophilin A)